jgi:hypothetical protein
MKNRTPPPRDLRPPLPDFDAVPRRNARHDGWTPERQRAFIEALADTGSVSRACGQVNMTTVGAYYLRRQPGAEGFRRAWEAALDFGVARMKDIAFERAVEGTLVPVITGGKLIGYRRIYNDRLLMFCLRMYGEDANGKRTTVNYFSTRATASAAASSSPERGGGPPQAVEGAHAEASTTTVRTIITGKDKDPLTLSLSKGERAIDEFEGVDLDPIAQEEIARALAQCAARRREALGTPDDEELPYLPVEPRPERPDFGDDLMAEHAWHRDHKRPERLAHEVDEDHALEHDPHLLIQPDEKFRSSDAEMPWEMLDDEEGMKRIEEAVESVKAAQKTKMLRSP